MASLSPSPRVDVLHLPLLGKLLRWRWSRLLGQLALLTVALLLVYDGFTGSQIASQNLATVSVWVHYRGLVILALLLAGNLFCSFCPFALPRSLARRWTKRMLRPRWPAWARNKWLAIVAFVGFLWVYEAFDLWASPALTAWIIIGYWLLALLLEALFAESPFCKYVCPLGTFNFVASTVSPLQIQARNSEVCRSCAGKECVNGSAEVAGCGLELFVPQVQSNLDCTFCLDCARACPYDNVALASRSPLHELSRAAWPQRWDVGLLALVFAFAALSNAFGMTPPVYTLEATLGRALGIASPALVLALLFVALMLILPAVSGLAAAALSRRWGGATGQRWNRDSLRPIFARYAPTVTPLAVGIWAAHYWFHFASGALSIVPIAQSFLLDHGITVLGQPRWSLPMLLSGDALFVSQLAAVTVGFLASVRLVQRVSAVSPLRPAANRSALPWLTLWALLAGAAVLVFSLPMEMRGLVG